MPSLSSSPLCLSGLRLHLSASSRPARQTAAIPGSTRRKDKNALFNLTTGVGNTAVGWFSLWSDTDGSYNTAVGAGTLLFNVGDPNTGLSAVAPRPKHGHWHGSAF